MRRRLAYWNTCVKKGRHVTKELNNIILLKSFNWLIILSNFLNKQPPVRSQTEMWHSPSSRITAGDRTTKELNSLSLDKHHLFTPFAVYISLLSWSKNIEAGSESNAIFWCWFTEEALAWKGTQIICNAKMHWTVFFTLNNLTDRDISRLPVTIICIVYEKVCEKYGKQWDNFRARKLYRGKGNLFFVFIILKVINYALPSWMCNCYLRICLYN